MDAPPTTVDMSASLPPNHSEAHSAELTNGQQASSSTAAAQVSSEASAQGTSRCEERSRRSSDELDRLGQRLDMLANRRKRESSVKASPRKNSAGSHIPAPEQPASSGHAANERVMSQSLCLPEPVAKATAEAARGSRKSTASMLKTTLRRMTGFGGGGGSPSKGQQDTSNGPSKKAVGNSGPGQNDCLKESDTGPAVATNIRQPLSRGASNSLKRAKSRDASTSSSTNGCHKSVASRSGTAATLERRSVSRSHSVHQQSRRAREREPMVRKSRAVQTQLTRDALTDADDVAVQGDEANNGAASLEFTYFMPDLLGSEVDPVETFTVEPSEPVDVRRNRALTLDNMKLTREAERLKAQLAEVTKERDAARRDRRMAQSRADDLQLKLTGEQELRARLEAQMDRRDEKMRAIAASMESVEREFENRDENIQYLERRVQEYAQATQQIQADLDASQDLVADLRQQLNRSLEKQKLLVTQLREVETEAKELQEFLQAEKMTLAETLKDCEAEIAQLKDQTGRLQTDNAALEERCSHLVRLSEQRYQETLGLQAQLSGIQERAKDMLLAQGAELSRASVHVSELHSQMESLLKGDGSSFSGSSSLAHSLTTDELSQTPAAVPSSVDGLSDDIQVQLTESVRSSETFGAYEEDGEAISDSLQSLSKAIAERQKSETNGGMTESLASSTGSLPSLVERINECSSMLQKLKAKNRVATVGSKGVNGMDDDVSGGKENVVVTAKAEELLKTKDNEISEMKNRFLRHRQILITNYQQAESEIKRIDEIHHESITRVLQALSSVPDVVQCHPQLQNLQKEFESLYDSKGVQKEITAVLKSDVGVNQSL